MLIVKEKLRDLELLFVNKIFEVFESNIYDISNYINVNKNKIDEINFFLNNKHHILNLKYFNKIKLALYNTDIYLKRIEIYNDSTELNIDLISPFNEETVNKHKLNTFFIYYGKFNKLPLIKYKLCCLEKILVERLNILVEKNNELSEKIEISNEYYNVLKSK